MAVSSPHLSSYPLISPTIATAAAAATNTTTTPVVAAGVYIQYFIAWLTFVYLFNFEQFPISSVSSYRVHISKGI